MSNGFGLPVVNFQQAVADIGTAYTDARDKAQKKTALARLGEQIQSNDYTGAAGTAFNAGDPAIGVNLLKLASEFRKERLGELTAGGFGRGLLDLYGGNAGAGSPGIAPGQDVAPATRGPAFSLNDGAIGGYLASTRARESGGNDLAANPNSTALGRYQFLESTWNGLAKQHPELGLTPDGRTDPAQQERAMGAFTRANAGALTDAGITINPGSLYGAHVLGASGFKRFFYGASNRPDAPATSYVSAEAASANRNVFFNRDGSPKSAGEVLAWMGNSGGGAGGRPAQATQRPASSYIDVSEDEAQTQALEQRMGMVPPAPGQMASADHQADIPAAGTSTAALPRVDGMNPGGFPVSGSPTLRRPAPPAPGAQAGGFGSVAVPTIGRSGAGGPAMTMPGEAPQQVAQAGTGATVANDATVGGVPVQSITQQAPGGRILFLMKALSNPYLPEAQRGIAQTLLKEALEQARMPDSVREFMWARGSGMTKAATPAEYEREKKGPQVVGAGSSMYDAQGKLIATAPERNRSNVADDVEARRSAAADLGLAPGSAAYQSYVLTGKMPREDAQPYTATDKKNILEADEKVLSNETVIGNLKDAKELSGKALAGPLSYYRGYASSFWGSESGQATLELNNLVTTNALGQLKAIFGAAPTEGERKILLEIAGSSDMPHALRVKIYDRAIGLAEKRLEVNRERASELRGQTYYRPGGGGAVSRSRDDAGSPRALPRPAPSNRPGAANAGDRFGQLVGSGMSREQAFEQMQQEGY